MTSQSNANGNGFSKRVTILLTIIGIIFSLAQGVNILLFNTARADVGQACQAVEVEKEKRGDLEHRVTCLEKDQYYQNLQIQETLKRIAPGAYRVAEVVVDSVKKTDGDSLKGDSL